MCLLAATFPRLDAQAAPPASSSNGSDTTIILATTNDNSSVDLTPRDIEVKEDGKAATVKDVRKLGRGPLEYCILFDTSGSGRDQFRLQQAEAQAFLNEALKAEVDRGRLYLFSDEARETAENANPRDFAPMIASSEPRNATALYDAIATCARRMLRNSPSTGFRIMFVFSDGEDNESHIPRTVAMEWALKAGIRIYSFNPTRDGSKRGRVALEDLARSTGGEAYSVRSENEMTSALSKLKAALENQFAVSYTPAASARNGLLDLSVKCRKKGVSISAPDKCYRPAQ